LSSGVKISFPRVTGRVPQSYISRYPELHIAFPRVTDRVTQSYISRYPELHIALPRVTYRVTQSYISRYPELHIAFPRVTDRVPQSYRSSYPELQITFPRVTGRVTQSYRSSYPELQVESIRPRCSRSRSWNLQDAAFRRKSRLQLPGAQIVAPSRVTSSTVTGRNPVSFSSGVGLRGFLLLFCFLFLFQVVTCWWQTSGACQF